MAKRQQELSLTMATAHKTAIAKSWQITAATTDMNQVEEAACKNMASKMIYSIYEWV